MTTVVHILATIFFASAVAVILYWLMRRHERQLGKECAVIFAVFGSGLISVAAIKTNSPPARAMRSLVSGIVGAFTEGYPYDRQTWPFDEATDAVVAGREAAQVPPIPDDMAATGVALYRISEEPYIPEPVAGAVRLSAWGGIDADNRGMGVNLPFGFPFNGTTYTNIGILSNGRLALGYATRHRRTSGGLPVDYPAGLEIVAPFWGNHLLAVADNASVTTLATGNSLGILWENLSTPASGSASNTTIACVLRDDGRMSWHYSPVHPSVASNVTVGVQSGTNAWMLANGGMPTNIAAHLSEALTVELVPVGGAEWALADADNDGLSNLEEFMLGTNPNLADTDGDGPSDRWELEHGYPPDVPLSPDVLPDTDGDGVPDVWESRIGTNPSSATDSLPCADTDGDGFLDAYEFLIGSAPEDFSDPPFPDEESEKGLVSCQIDSSLPCWLVMAYDDDAQRTNEVRLAWVPGVSPESVFLLLDAARRASVHLEREETNGYWRTSLEVSVGYVSSVAKTQSADADPYGGSSVTTGLRGGRGGGSSWVRPGGRIGDTCDIEYWRFLLPSEGVNFCHDLDYAEILLPSLIGYDGTTSWSIEPDGPNGTGNPVVFNPSELAPGAYDVVIGIDTLEGTLEKTITLNVRSLSLTSTRLVVDATDTSTHYLPIDGNGTFIPDDDDFVVISVPEGIDSIDFVPADLEPGTTYTVDIWNGDCGYQTVEVVAAKVEITPQAEWPDFPRSDLGVGELLNCSVSPESLNVTWGCTDGRAIFDDTSNSSTIMSVLDVPGALTVTASIDGVPIETNYVVHAPEVFYACRYKANTQLYRDEAGVGCWLNVYLSPTNVSFENVWLKEGTCHPTNITGWFAESVFRQKDHDGNHGALRNVKCFPGEFGWCFVDDVFTGLLRKPWSAGSIEWDIPMYWWIAHAMGSEPTYHRVNGLSPMHFEIDSDGTVTFTKFGARGVRQTNGVDRYYDSNGVQQ